jgi:subtilisin family serine protease
MKRGWHMRMLLLAVAIAAGGLGDARAQCTTNSCPPPSPPLPPPNNPLPIIPPSHRNNSVWYALGGGIAAPIIGVGIAIQFLPVRSSDTTTPKRTFPPRQRLDAQLPSLPGLGGPGGPGGGGEPGAGGGPVGPVLRSSFNLPARGAPYVLDQVIADAPTNVINAIAARHNMTVLQSNYFPLINSTLHLLHIDDGASVPAAITDMAADSEIRGGQANFIFRLAQSDEALINADQYAPQKLNLAEAHRLARGNRVLIAVIDSEVDASHPDLAGAIAGNFEAAGDGERPHPHGTGMAGAIAARKNMLGTAPAVQLLTVRAFSPRAGSAEGTTYNIIKGLDWAAAQGARVVNMSFAGPSDPRLREALAKANARGMVLVAAAGNAGPGSPPLFPAADPNVIAVTATNADDKLFTGANRGNYIAVAAPGVDILAPAPEGAHQFTTGTSVAAAEVSGVAALLLERNPSLTPAEVRKILMDTAKDLGPRGHDRDFGAGLVNALKALTSVRSR